MSDDYGYFGKGTEGYIHYMQAQGESSRKNGGGGKRGGNGGCLSTLLILCVLVIAPLLISQLL